MGIVLDLGYYAIRGAFWLGAGYLADKAIKDSKATVDAAGTAATKTANLTRWVVIGGGVYVAYRVAQKSGFAK